MTRAQVVLQEIEMLWAAFVNCRARAPRVPNGAVGGSCFRTAPWYAQQGYDVVLSIEHEDGFIGAREGVLLGKKYLEQFI